MEEQIETLLKFEIVPDVVEELPRHLLNIHYGHTPLHLGNQLQVEILQSPPTSIDCEDVDPSSFYTLCLTDPDAPTRSAPVMRERLHWLVVNIPGGSWREGEELVAYVPPCPPKGSGLHRYTFLLFRQPCALSFDGEVRVDGSKDMWDLRKCFSIRKWVRKWGLMKRPHAASFFVAEWDTYAQLTRDSLGL